MAAPQTLPSSTPANHGEVKTDLVGLATAVGSVVTTKTAAYTAVAGDYVACDATTAAFTVTLPTAPSSGVVVVVMKTDSSSNAVTVVGAGSTTINGQASATITEQYAGATFLFDGSNWLIRSVM